MILAYGQSQGTPPPTARFSLIALAEPPKEVVLRGASVGRAAFAVIYDPPSNRTWEAIANLAEYHVDSFKEIPGAQPAISGLDSARADRIVRADPRWRRAMEERGIHDLNSVAIVAWSAGYFALPGANQGRIVRALSYYSGAGANIDAHPVEGVVAEVDLTAGRIIEMLDTNRDAQVSRENFELDPASNRLLRSAPAPLTISQPQPAFQIDDGEVRWQKWRFRFALHPREGLVLYTVGYEDGGRVRSILYRGSVSEMVVPYGDPSGAWFFRNSFDAGELGLGSSASPLRPVLIAQRTARCSTPLWPIAPATRK
jgi:primary-amine oxidase